LLTLCSKIEVAYEEAVALKRQEELIREEAAWLAETEKKAKRASEKEKKSKKKQVLICIEFHYKNCMKNQIH